MGPKKEHSQQFQRMHYLYQAASYCLHSDPKDVNLCRFYLSTMKTIAMKSVLRMHVDIKRTICKTCHVLLVPGVTSTVRTKNKGKKSKHLVVTCLECRTMKRFLLTKGYKLWVENPEAWLSGQLGKKNNQQQNKNTTNDKNRPIDQSKQSSNCQQSIT